MAKYRLWDKERITELESTLNLKWLGDSIPHIESPTPWECGVCGLVFEKPLRHIVYNIQKSRCPECSNKKEWTLDRLDKTLVGRKISLCNRDRFDEVRRAQIKGLWQCSNKHTWEASLLNVVYNKSGCPHCKPVYKGEEIVKEVLLDLGLLFDREWSFPRSTRRYDFRILNPIFLIEFQGLQHDRPYEGFVRQPGDFERTLLADQEKRDLAIENSIPLLEIWYSKTGYSKSKIKKTIEDFLRDQS